MTETDGRENRLSFKTKTRMTRCEDNTTTIACNVVVCVRFRLLSVMRRRTGIQIERSKRMDAQCEEQKNSSERSECSRSGPAASPSLTGSYLYYYTLPAKSASPERGELQAVRGFSKRRGGGRYRRGTPRYDGVRV